MLVLTKPLENKFVVSVRGGFVVHIYKKGANFRVKPKTKYITYKI